MAANEKQPLRLLGLYAHPDDETFCTGGTLARYTAQGAEAMVVSFTRGEAGQIRDAEVATRRTLGSVRAQELQNACRRLGVRHVSCLDYGDGKLAQVPQETLVCHATEIIRRFRPHLVFTFDDTGAYGHPDHVAISRAATAAVWAAADATRFPEQIEAGLAAHTPLRLYHACFPRRPRLLLDLLVRWLVSLDAKFRGSQEFIHGLMLLADESTMLGYAADHIQVAWYPKGFYIIEQGEPAISLYLVLSGSVDIYQEDAAGEKRHVASRGPGFFLGETGLAYGHPRNAHVVAADSVTCLVFSPGEPTNFAGRGETGDHAVAPASAEAEGGIRVTTAIDVRDWIPQKMAALCQYRTQYPISEGMFPHDMLVEMLGYEYFCHVQRPGIETELLPSDQVPGPIPG
jgi:LmbE family N-acetylglucosaminyl deacetylase